jgi:hypothetical protein
MRFVLAACYLPYFLSGHEDSPVIELAHKKLHAVRDRAYHECPAL